VGNLLFLPQQNSAGTAGRPSWMKPRWQQCPHLQHRLCLHRHQYPHPGFSLNRLNPGKPHQHHRRYLQSQSRGVSAVPAKAPSVLMRSIVGSAGPLKENIPSRHHLYLRYLFLLQSVSVQPAAHRLPKKEYFVVYAERASIVLLHPLPYPPL
jgi:hypothetical protein